MVPGHLPFVEGCCSSSRCTTESIFSVLDEVYANNCNLPHC